MKRLVALCGLLLVIGCGGGTVVLPTVPRGGVPTLPAGIPTLPPGLTIPPLVLPSMPPGEPAAPTSELIQIVNIYVPGDETPYGFDIYILHASPFGAFAAADPLPTDTPIAHADFGAASAPFDPGSLDGSEAWAAYRAGKPPTHDNLVWNFAQGVVDGGRSTVVMSSGSNFAAPDASPKDLTVQVSYRNDKDPGQGQTLAPTTGTLIYDISGLDSVWGDTNQKVVWVQVGDKCLDYQETPGQPQPALPGGPTYYLNTPTGSVQVTTFANDQGHPGCAGTPSSTPVTADIPVGGFAYVFGYSTNLNELKAFSVAPLH